MSASICAFLNIYLMPCTMDGIKAMEIYVSDYAIQQHGFVVFVASLRTVHEPTLYLKICLNSVDFTVFIKRIIH